MTSKPLFREMCTPPQLNSLDSYRAEMQMNTMSYQLTNRHVVLCRAARLQLKMHLSEVTIFTCNY